MVWLKSVMVGLVAAAGVGLGVAEVNMEIPQSPTQRIRITRFADDPSSGRHSRVPRLEKCESNHKGNPMAYTVLSVCRVSTRTQR